jgi:hypothetical protein
MENNAPNAAVPHARSAREPALARSPALPRTNASGAVRNRPVGRFCRPRQARRRGDVKVAPEFRHLLCQRLDDAPTNVNVRRFAGEQAISLDILCAEELLHLHLETLRRRSDRLPAVRSSVLGAKHLIARYIKQTKSIDASMQFRCWPHDRVRLPGRSVGRTPAPAALHAQTCAG